MRQAKRRSLYWHFLRGIRNAWDDAKVILPCAVSTSTFAATGTK